MTAITGAVERLRAARPGSATWRLAWQAAALYLVLRLITGLLLWRASADQVPFPPWTDADPGYLDMTVMWDGTWYRRVAEQGYPVPLPVGTDGQVAQNAWAFYPVFPMVSRALMALTGLSFPVVGSTVALLTGTGAAMVMVALFRRIAPSWTALAAVAVWAACPPSAALQIAYSDAPAMLVLVAAFWALLTRRWALTAALALLLGFTRPIVAPLGVVVGVAVLVRWWRRRSDPIGAGEYAGMVAALAGCAVGAFEWSWLVGRRTGVSDGYWQTMSAWRAGHEIHPFSGWRVWAGWILSDTDDPARYGRILLVAMAAALVLLPIGPWATRLGPELRTWMLAYPAYLAVVLDPSTSVWRYALPLFPAALVLVGGAGRVRAGRRTMFALTVLLVGLGIVVQAVWIWKLLVFHPPTDFPP